MASPPSSSLHYNFHPENLTWAQLKVMLWKNAKIKRRNPCSACCECFSPCLLILVLAWGFSLSSVTKIPAHNYAVVNVQFPGPLFGAALGSQVGGGGGGAGDVSTMLKLLEGPLPIPTFDQFASLAQQLSTNVGPAILSSGIKDSAIGQSMTNLLSLGAIHIAPDNEATRAYVNHMEATSARFSDFPLYIHPDEDTAISYVNNHLNDPTWAVLVLDSLEEDKVDFTIRMNSSVLPNTNFIVNWISTGLDSDYQNYYLSGFLTLQQSIYQFASNYTTQGGCEVRGALGIPFPTAAYDQNTFYTAVGYLLGLAMTMSTLYPVSRLLKDMVEEKESRMKETMKIMGLKTWIHNLSWFLSAVVLFLWIAILVTGIMCKTFMPSSAVSLIFIYVFLFLLSEIAFVFFLSAFFSRAKLAAIVGPVSLFATVLPRYVFYGSNRYEAQKSKYLASLLSATAFTFGADVIADYEYANLGIQWDNMNEGFFSFQSSLQMMFLDFWIYLFLAWYLERVIPGEYGTHEHPLFLCMPSWWMGKTSSAVGGKATTMADDDELGGQANADDMYEGPPDPAMNPPRVIIKGLVKRYHDGNLAVKNLDLTMYENQVTCLLGHNGAGKTTTISMVTGLIPPTRGSCSIWGKDLKTQLDKVRQGLGVCPQVNVLFPELTVKEHLTFFARLKGMPYQDLDSRVHEITKEVGLVEKLHVYSKNLSGGMKRKLCIANALIGSPKFVLLDEPTSGMDPFSRRATWEMIRRCKQNRVVVLTTHYLDEAEVLGDRICIMSGGRLKTSGTSLFLKNRFGSGYSLTIVRKHANHHPMDDETSAPFSRIGRFIQGFIPNARLFSQAGAELLFRLPLSCAHTFPSLLNELEVHKEILEVDSFGISMITLEDVFLRIARDEPPPQTQPPTASIAMTVGQDGDHHADVASEEQQQHVTSPIHGGVTLGTNPVVELAVRGEDHIPQHSTGHHNPEKIWPMGIVAGDNGPNQQDTDNRRSDGPPKSPPPYPDLRKWLETLRRQLWLLVWKRYIVAKRDLKGLFFQIILPAGLIAAVLLILTIKPKIAGPSIPMDFSLYKTDATQVLYSSSNPGSPKLALVNQPSTNNYMDWQLNPSRTSYNLSDYMLATYNDHSRSARLGAYVFDDLVLMNVTIDYPYIKENQQEVLGALVMAAFIMGVSDLSVEEDGLVVYDKPITIPFSVDNNDASAAVDQELIPSQEAINGLLSAFNITDSQVFQFFNVSAPANATLNDLAQTPDLTIAGSLKAQRVVVNTTSGEVQLQDTQLVTAGGQSLPMGDVSANINDLPDQRQLTQFYLARSYTVLHNSSSPHAVAAFYGELTRLQYEECTDRPGPTFVARNHPLPLTEGETLEVQTILAIFTAIFLLIPLCYIPAAFATFIVKERACKAKHLQLVSGVNRQLYWVSTYLWDLAQYFILNCLIMVVFYLYGGGATRTFLYNHNTSLATGLLLWLYGMSSIPLAYLYSFGFENPSTAQIIIMGLNFITGFVMVLSYYIMLSIPKTAKAAAQAVKVFRLFPTYQVGDGLINLSTMYYKNYFWGEEEDAFDWEVVGRPLHYMVWECVILLALTLFIDSDLYERLMHALGMVQDRITGLRSMSGRQGAACVEDDDVQAEKALVLDKSKPADYAVTLMHLKKTYRQGLTPCGGTKHAVKGITLGIPQRQCFGFLGINGSGKTTTLSILTGDLRETSGACYVQGLPSHTGAARKQMGYCPQIDPLLEWMTGRETLLFYGQLKGLSHRTGLTKVVKELIQRVGLERHADKPCGRYSGGNKRKLSLAVALIADPPVILLDEPSSGMDAEARRKMWDVITDCTRAQSIILTTHSMEECEALCSRVGIMVGGQLRCLGSCQHLKHLYGHGYKVDVKCHNEAEVSIFHGSLSSLFPGCHLEESHGLQLRYSISKEVLQSQGISRLGDLFQMLEQCKVGQCIDEYCVSQTTLEEIFIKFAKQQEEETTEVAGMSYSRGTTAMTTVSEEGVVNPQHQGDIAVIMASDSISGSQLV